MKRRKVAVVHPRLGSGGSEARALWLLQALRVGEEPFSMADGKLNDLAGHKVMAKIGVGACVFAADIERALWIVTALAQIEGCRPVIEPMGIRIGTQNAVSVVEISVDLGLH